MFRDVVGTALFIIALVTALGFAAVEIYELQTDQEVMKDDGPIEEMAEDFVESQTGIKLDFSPRTPEQ